MLENRVSRRSLLKMAAAGAAAAPWFLGSPALAAPTEFELPKLPWPQDALAPLISKETISYHYGKHHAAYVTNLNKLVKGTPYETMTLAEIVKKAPPGPLFNNAAQNWNHTFYWSCLAPGAGGEPAGPLAEAIQKSFGSFAKFKEQFTDTAVKLFRFRLGLAGPQSRRQSGRHRHEQRGHAADRRQNAAVGLRRLGARLLHRLSQSPSRIRRGVLEARRLEGGRNPQKQQKRHPAASRFVQNQRFTLR